MYSNRDINMNEELTYDYKFEVDNEKLDCYCGAKNCLGRLN
jgi:histone-lysine N-methyltransferase SETD1